MSADVVEIAKQSRGRRARHKRKEEKEEQARVGPRDTKVVLVNQRFFASLQDQNERSKTAIQPETAYTIADFPDLSSGSSTGVPAPPLTCKWGARRDPFPRLRAIKNETLEKATGDVQLSVKKEPVMITFTKSDEAPSTSAEVADNGDVPILPVSNKKKRKGPLIIEMTSALKARQRGKEFKKSTVTFKHKKLQMERLSGNILDASNPIRSKGKYREGKKKRLSPLKMNVIKERIIKSLASTEVDVVGSTVDFKREIEVYLNRRLAKRRDEAESKEFVKRKGPQTEMERRSCCVVTKYKFSNKFRWYCENMLTPQLDEAVKFLIQGVMELQDKAFAKDPLKARMRKRHVTGLREIAKYLKVKKVKVLIIAPDLEASNPEGPIGKIIMNLKQEAADALIPCVFALTRKKLGYVSLRNIPVSAFAILSYEGMEERHNFMMKSFEEARLLFHEKFHLSVDQNAEGVDVVHSLLQRLHLSDEENVNPFLSSILSHQAEVLSDDDEEKEIPRLKYFRFTNDVSDILFKHPATCLAVHPKFLCIGTAWGSIHLVDHQGYNVRSARSLQGHSVAVNCLDIDERGDFVASCSDDGIVRVSGLYKDDSDHSIQTGRLVKCVAIDPAYGKTGAGRRFITGDEKLILHEKTFLSMWKSTVIREAEGSVNSVCWKGNFVAWASDLGVRVYDLYNKCSLGFMKWAVNDGVAPQFYRCNMAWCYESTLLIGWVDTVRICTIRKRGPGDVSGPQLPDYMVEPLCSFTTDFFMSGICPLAGAERKDLQLVLLGYCKELDDDGCAKRPTLQVVQPTNDDYIEVARPDELFLKDLTKNRVNDYHLEHVAEENRYFVVSPRDIVVASVYDNNDIVEWLLKNERYEEALEAVSGADKFTVQQVGGAYIDYLFGVEEYEKAGEFCAKILGKDKKLWEEKIYKLAKIHQLKAISAYLPVGDYRLDESVYEMVLYEFLKTDTPRFLELIKKWPPSLYDVQTVINSVVEHVVNDHANDLYLMESLAILYSHISRYDMALQMYLKLKHKDIFAMIHRHNLYSSVLKLVMELMTLDADQAVGLFLESPDIFKVDAIVKEIEGNKMLLYQYLDALDSKDSKLARSYHGVLVKLHADFGHERLLSFLRRSNHYPIHEALKICQERKFYPEMVYLLNRMGRSKEALMITIEELRDIQQAIEFCKEQDDSELWQDLIGKSLDKPDFITYLLNNIGTAVDPAILVERIAPKLVIPGLKTSLAKMMKDYSLQVCRPC